MMVEKHMKRKKEDEIVDNPGHLDKQFFVNVNVENHWVFLLSGNKDLKIRV